MSTIIYGIKNCDTMKKAFTWLEANNIAYSFHDYKKAGVDMDVLKQGIAEHGWENIINRKGTSWRKLSESEQASMDEAKAIQAAQDNPSLIRRPLLAYKGKIHIGFSESSYKAIF